MSLANATIETLAGVKAELNYLAPTSERPRTYTYDPPAGTPRTTVVNEPHVLHISNMRSTVDDISLDAQGFDLVGHRTAVRDFYNEQEVRSIYYPEAEDLLKQATIPYAAAYRAARTGAPTRRGSRFRGFMSITPPDQARSESATCCRMKPKSCCADACR
jgi:hypothetical protein